jgi:protein SCO1
MHMPSMVLRPQRAPRCGARSKRTKMPCRAPAVRGFHVCRFHGARGGAAHGNRNAWKHGVRGAAWLRQARDLRALVRGAAKLVAASKSRVHGVVRSNFGLGYPHRRKLAAEDVRTGRSVPRCHVGGIARLYVVCPSFKGSNMSIGMLRAVRYGAIALIGALALVWAAVGLGFFAPPDEARYGASVVGDFRLSDQDGAVVTAQTVLSRPSIVFFGFAYCPDVCPTTLTAMTALMGRLGPDADKLGAYFVTVDPERDTASSLKAYLASFDKRIRGLTGPADQIAAIARPLGVFYERSGTGTNYTMDHTASVFLLDADGRLRGTIAYGEDAAVAEAKVRALLR